MRIAAVIMAAGQGTRMRSSLPKVLHPLLGRPMVWYAIEAASQASGTTPVLIVGHGAEQVRQVVGEAAHFVLQQPQLGTAHAVQQAETLLRGHADLVLVTAADMPLLSPQTLQALIEAQREQRAPLTLLSAHSEDSRGFGRILRNAEGRIVAVVEEAQATPEQLALRELNVGAYCFSAEWLWEALKRVPLSPKGEYYLTDVVALAAREGFSVQALPVEEVSEIIGINTRVHLAEAEAILRHRINQSWMLAGVTLVDPQTTYIEAGVEIGQDTIIYPNTYLQGKTRVGQACILGPNTILRDTQVGNRCQILASVVDQAIVEDDVDIGPFAHLRKGAHLAKGVHMGNFGEVKNSYLGPGTKMGHFSYVGDATIGANVNIGAGTITCNFDGKKKNPTTIEEEAFIGSDTMLIAPVKVGKGARTGAGAVVTKDLPPYTLAVGVPARVIRKLKEGE